MLSRLDDIPGLLNPLSVRCAGSPESRAPHARPSPVPAEELTVRI
ncbi:MAG: hypothetical protein ACPIOQ_21265 [Promethearchaeia archaeon]